MMSGARTVREWFAQQMHAHPFILLDGAIGTELERGGYRTSLPLWSAMAALDVPELLEDLHAQYLLAGAQVITANTFRTTRYTAARAGLAEMVPELIRRSIEIARKAVHASGFDALVAASLAPLEDCYRPDLVPDDQIIEDNYSEQIGLLLDSGADLILAETMLNASEVRIAAHVCKELDAPLMISLLVEKGALLDGTPLAEIIAEIQAADPLAILLNCRHVKTISENLPGLKSLTDVPVGAFANGPGHPDPETGWMHDDGTLDEYVDAAQVWLKQGAAIIGGCCGTTPGHIAAVRGLREAG